MLITFGKHKGTDLSKVPTDYLAWVCKTDLQKPGSFRQIEEIAAEYRRRTNQTGFNYEVTQHAIDRAFQRLYPHYQKMRKPNESMCKWLKRVFAYVLKNGTATKPYSSRNGKKFRLPRREFYMVDSIRGVEWKFVTEGNSLFQNLITVYAPGG